MIRLAQLCIRHPRRTIAAWLVLVVGLGILGSQIEGRFAPSILVPKGTESARAQQLASSRFGDSVLTPIMLVGPASQLDKQGPPLVAKLRARTDTRVLSPWDGTPGSDALRPHRNTATIVAAIERPEKQVISTTLPQIEKTVAASVHAPVQVHITGQASIDRAMRQQTLNDTRIALAIALPALLLILIVLTRAPIAALTATGFVITVLAAGYGLTAICASLIPVDAIAVAGASMVGLALASGFTLLVVTRFRDELSKAGGDATHAAEAAAVTTAKSAGRAVLIAGTATVVAMIIATSLSMTEILNSIGIGATMMATVAGLAGVAILPAVLHLVGPRVEWKAFGGAAATTHRLHPLTLPAATVVLVAALMVPLAAPILSLGSGPPDAKLLPSDNKARQDYEAVARVMGQGWVSPFEVIVTRSGSPVTTRKFLAQLDKFEKNTAKMSGVDSVLGPGALLANANDLQGVPKGLNTAAATATSSKKDLKKLIAGLKLATDGVAQVRGGLGAAATGAGQLHGGTGQAYGGSGQLTSGLNQANAGAQQLKVGAAQAAAGAKDLAGGLELAQAGVSGGLPSIQKLIDAVNSNAKEVNGLAAPATATKGQVDAAAAALAAMTVGRDDPHYSAVVTGLQQAASSNQALSSAIATAGRNASLNAMTVVVIKNQVTDLQAGISKLSAGANQLSTGLRKLASGNSDLASGISQLDSGGAQLQDGLRQLNTGAGQLAQGLESGVGPSGELLGGMQTITKAVIKSRASIPSTKDLVKLRKEAPGLFDSGYFVLAAIDGAPRPARDAAAFVVNVANGGYAGRITVVPKQPPQTAATLALHDRLSERAAAFARANHAQAAVGGTGADLVDYRNLGLERLPLVLAALTALGFIVMLLVTRSLVTAGLGVLLNLGATGAAFGVLALLFGGDNPPLGGPGFVDPVTIVAILTAVVSLAISYEVFAVERLRLVTGAGGVMLVVLLPFVGATLTLVREFAIGLAVAVAIDTALVRPVLASLRRTRPPTATPTTGTPNGDRNDPHSRHQLRNRFAHAR